MDGPQSSALRCSGLVKRYQALVAVDGLDLEIPRGECLGLLGPNGAGKTTTVELLEGLMAPDGGTIEVFGMRWGSGRDREIRARIGVQLQETQLADKLTVEETLRLFRSFYARGRPLEEVIQIVELGEKKGTRVGKLSGGQRQRLALGCALVSNPELLFLDEPTTGLDPQVRRRIWDIIDGFRRGGGTVCLTTHYMEEAEVLCTQVAIMDRGKILALGTPAQLIEELDAQQVVELRTARTIDPALFTALPGARLVRAKDRTVVLSVTRSGGSLPAILIELDRCDVNIESMTTHQATLEDVFIHLTGRGLRDE